MIHQHQAQLFANQQNFMNDMNYLQYRHQNDIYNMYNSHGYYKEASNKKEDTPGDEGNDLEEDNYFKIDGKNTFSVCDSNESKDKLDQLLNDNDEYMQDNSEHLKKTMNLFYETIYKTDSDPFDMCCILSKHLMKSLNIERSIIDEKLDFFINKKNKYKYSKTIELDINNTNYLGYIISYSYSKLSKFKINTGKDLETKVEKTRNEKMDALTLYYAESLEKQKSEEQYSKTLFCKKNKHKFDIPGPLIFLINTFVYINTIEINFNFDEKKLKKDDVNLFIISILNVQYLFGSGITVKINLINEELQCFIYRRYYKELFNKAKIGDFKMTYMNKNDLYKQKWDFETEFLLEKHRKNRRQNLENSTNYDTSVEEKTTISNYISNKSLFRNPTKIELFNRTYINSSEEKFNNLSEIQASNYYSNKNVNIFNLSKDDSSGNNNINNTSTSSKNVLSTSQFTYNTNLHYPGSSNLIYKIKNNPNENIKDMHYYHIIKRFEKTLGLMILTIDSLSSFTNMNRLDLILNECYKGDFKLFLLNHKCVSDNNDQFTIIDILINNVKRLTELNIEINILDHITFNKIISFINENTFMTSIKISFFSSDATYLRQTLYKLFHQNFRKKPKYIPLIINMMFPYFMENLEVLFELIKRRDFKIIAFNFDTPSIIEKNDSYLNAIFKFIMNILFLVDNKKSHIGKLVILSPSTKFDSRLLPTIENILEDINFNENNKILTELSIHFQLFMLKNIKNLFTERLIILSVGDCDIYTFKQITIFFNSYKFCKKSSLKKLSVSLLDSIIHYTNEIHKIFYKIFSIKIRELKEINIYTNIYLHIEKYNYLMDIFKNNWVSKYRIVFNPKSDIYLYNLKEEEEKNKILYLVSHSLEDTLLSNKELVERNKIFINKSKKNSITQDRDDNIYWIMWQLNYRKNKKNKQNARIRKKIIFNILKYLYFTKPVDIQYELE
jgi:hypothetical protein